MNKKYEAEGTPENPIFRVARDRRMKVLFVSPALILNLVFSPLERGRDVRITKIEGLPEWVEVERVTFSPERDAYCFWLYSPEFPVVENGAIPEELIVSSHIFDIPVDEYRHQKIADGARRRL